MNRKAGHTDNSDSEGAVGLVPSRISGCVRDDFCANRERLGRAKNGCDLDNNLRNKPEYICIRLYTTALPQWTYGGESA